jgi:hypothetical protein
MTGQSAFTVMTKIETGRLSDLKTLLNSIGDDIDGNPYLRLADLPHLHFACFAVVDAGPGAPYLVFEGNVDGRRNDFLRQMIATAGQAVDLIYQHCRGYPAQGTRDVQSVLSYFQLHDIGANTFYVAWPGATVEDIRREDLLRTCVEKFLNAQSPALRTQSPEAIRLRIAQHVRADEGLGWAVTPASKPFFVHHGTKVLAAIVAAPVLLLLGIVVAARKGSSRPRRILARMGVAAIASGAALAAKELRTNEQNDDRKDRQRVPDWRTTYAQWSEDQLGGVREREDVQIQNHMVSVTRIKEGWFRLTTLRLVLWVINLDARLQANKGSLGGISSIHFARWVITPDGKSLIFLSNFDGSWERYLTDFIDLASKGLTAVWTNTDNEVGFPHTEWLVTKGARDEARFKAFGRYSMVPSNVWYSAYPDLTVSNIANNREIRNDLFSSLDPPAVRTWLRRL